MVASVLEVKLFVQLSVMESCDHIHIRHKGRNETISVSDLTYILFTLYHVCFLTFCLKPSYAIFVPLVVHNYPCDTMLLNRYTGLHLNECLLFFFLNVKSMLCSYAIKPMVGVLWLLQVKQSREVGCVTNEEASTAGVNEVAWAGGWCETQNRGGGCSRAQGL